MNCIAFSKLRGLFFVSIIALMFASGCGDDSGGVCTPNSHPTQDGCQCDEGYLGGPTGCKADKRFVSQIFSEEDLLFAPMKGPLNARVTIVEFCGFQCSFCMRTAPLLDDMLTEFHGEVQVYWLHTTLAVHLNGRPAAFSSIAAFSQDRFWDYHDRLFAERSEWSMLPEDDIQDYFDALAESMGFDMQQWETDLANDEATYILQQDRALGDDLNVRITPTVYINDTRVEDAWEVESLRAAIQQALDDNP